MQSSSIVQFSIAEGWFTRKYKEVIFLKRIKPKRDVYFKSSYTLTCPSVGKNFKHSGTKLVFGGLPLFY